MRGDMRSPLPHAAGGGDVSEAVMREHSGGFVTRCCGGVAIFGVAQCLGLGFNGVSDRWWSCSCFDRALRRRHWSQC